MRYAILSDIHGNAPALDACLADIVGQGVDAMVLLGDLVGYGADPEHVVDWAAAAVAAGAIAVRGNHDDGIALPDPDMGRTATRALDWTRDRLTPAQRAFLAGLPLTALLPGVLLVHANAWAPGGWDYVLTPVHAERSLGRTDQPVTLVGHTHQPMVYHQAPGRPAQPFVPVADVALPMGGPGRRWLAVIGAVGQPRDGNPAAAYAIWDAQARSLTHRRVPYDAAEAARRIRARGLPEACAARLLTGS